MVYAFDVYDAIALTIHANNNEISNRTTIQKLIYFHTLRIKELQVSYRNHFYGPFSSKVASALDEMVAFSYLDARTTVRYNHESYRYTLIDAGEKYVANAKETFQDEYNIINETVKICNEHCKLKATELSYSAKAHYILANTKNDGYTTHDIEEVAKKFDWDVSETNAETGMKLLENLHIVAST